VPLKNFINDYGKEKISLHHTSLKDIIDGDMYTNKWIESFKDRNIRNKRLKVCSMFCGVEA
jgi:archaellum component FlaG (FlaF/FlaG flagellin family)